MSSDSPLIILQPTQAERWITGSRFAPYLEEAGGDYDTAVALYIWNARVSAAAFETLHHVEVLLRNAIDLQFVPVDPTAVPGETWLQDDSLLNESSRRLVSETIDRIGRAHSTPTRGRVVAGLSFGFWRALFDKKYSALWVSHLNRAFTEHNGKVFNTEPVLQAKCPKHHKGKAHHKRRHRAALRLLRAAR